jgi:hypothetical protein
MAGEKETMLSAHHLETLSTAVSFGARLEEERIADTAKKRAFSAGELSGMCGSIG